MDTPSRIAPPDFPRRRRVTLLERASIAAAIAVAACTPVPLAQMATTARADFSETHTCPLHRVAARLIDPTPPVPERIARDPERYAMWRRAAAKRAVERRLVHVHGCDEEASYSCWDVGGYVPHRRGHGSTRTSIGASCIEQNMEVPR